MEEQIQGLEEFINIYVLDSSIKEIRFINKEHDSKWVISYTHDSADDEFETERDMIEFLQADQYSE